MHIDSDVTFLKIKINNKSQWRAAWSWMKGLSDMITMRDVPNVIYIFPWHVDRGSTPSSKLIIDCTRHRMTWEKDRQDLKCCRNTTSVQCASEMSALTLAWGEERMASLQFLNLITVPPLNFEIMKHSSWPPGVPAPWACRGIFLTQPWPCAIAVKLNNIPSIKPPGLDATDNKVWPWSRR